MKKSIDKLLINYNSGYIFWLKSSRDSAFLTKRLYKNLIDENKLFEEKQVEDIVKKSLSYANPRSFFYLITAFNKFDFSILLKISSLLGFSCLLIGISGFEINHLYLEYLVKYYGCLYVLVQLFNKAISILSLISKWFHIFDFEMPEITSMITSKSGKFMFYFGFTSHFLLDLFMAILSLLFQLFISLYYIKRIGFIKDEYINIDVNYLFRNESNNKTYGAVLFVLFSVVSFVIAFIKSN